MASVTNIYISGLPTHIDEAALRQIFEPFGAIQSLRVSKDKTTGLSRGQGLVQFINPNAAAQAIASMNGAPVDGSTLLVKPANRGAGEKAAAVSINSLMAGAAFGAPVAGPSDNVFVSGFPREWTEADLNVVFGACGEIASSVILLNKTTGLSKGAGLVRFANVASAMHAVQSMNGSVVEGTGRQLEVKFADRPEEKGMRRAMQAAGLPQMRFSPYGKGGAMATMFGKGMGGPAAMMGPLKAPKRSDVTPEENANLHIFGLDDRVTDLHLYETFASYGAIRSVKAMQDPVTGVSKGFGFVQFYSAQDAQSAIHALNGVQMGNKQWSISVHKKKGQ